MYVACHLLGDLTIQVLNCWQDDIYYIIRDLGNDFNVGVTIAPFSAPVKFSTTLCLS